jgi:hypothetical protein
MALHLRPVPAAAVQLFDPAFRARVATPENRRRFVRLHLRSLVRNLEANADIEEIEAFETFTLAALDVIAQRLAQEGEHGEILAIDVGELLLERFRAARGLLRAAAQVEAECLRAAAGDNDPEIVA